MVHISENDANYKLFYIVKSWLSPMVFEGAEIRQPRVGRFTVTYKNSCGTKFRHLGVSENDVEDSPTLPSVQATPMETESREPVSMGGDLYDSDCTEYKRRHSEHRSKLSHRSRRSHRSHHSRRSSLHSRRHSHHRSHRRSRHRTPRKYNPTKITTNPFINFFIDYQKEMPRATCPAIAKKAGRLWWRMTAKEKLPYITAARCAKACRKGRSRRRCRRRRRRYRTSRSRTRCRRRRRRRRRSTCRRRRRRRRRSRCRRRRRRCRSRYGRRRRRRSRCRRRRRRRRSGCRRGRRRRRYRH